MAGDNILLAAPASLRQVRYGVVERSPRLVASRNKPLQLLLAADVLMVWIAAASFVRQVGDKERVPIRG